MAVYMRGLSASVFAMANEDFKKRLDQVEALYNELVALREGAKEGVERGTEELVLTELRLDNAWRELYEFMDLPLSRDGETTNSPE
jgi:ABC-type phosphate transport system auxiliary subunit